jgi:hypothetical protein
VIGGFRRARTSAGIERWLKTAERMG